MPKVLSRLSCNKTDVRYAALAGLDLRVARDLLDLGCGYGFMSEKVLRRVAPDARITGVDACETNRPAFLGTAERSGHRGDFWSLRLTEELPWPDKSFDLVIASYSLYFFPGLIHEIARVLRPDGLFLGVTHSESSASYATLYEAIRWDESRSQVLALARKFSAENGTSKLQEHFRLVEVFRYDNHLHVEAGHLADLLRYVRFKLPLFLGDSSHPQEVPASWRENLTEMLKRKRSFTMDKTDAIFRCRLPRG